MMMEQLIRKIRRRLRNGKSVVVKGCPISDFKEFSTKDMGAFANKEVSWHGTFTSSREILADRPFRCQTPVPGNRIPTPKGYHATGGRLSH
jgi:hypothetical protein